MPTIDSPHNPKVRAAAALRDRRDRLAAGLTLVDGGRECRRAIEAGVTIETAFICLELIRSDEAEAALSALQRRGIEVVELGRRAFEAVAFGDRADGVVLVVRPPSTRLVDLQLGPEPLILVTEAVEKPGNLGAILRTAAAAGCDAVVAIGGTDIFNPNVVRASIGAAFSVPLVAAGADEVLAWLRDRAIRIVTTRVDAERTYTDADLRGPVAIVLGSEAHGLSEAWRGGDVGAVRVPMQGPADSLNVGVTAAILAYEARRQRGFGPAETQHSGGTG